MVLCQCCAIMLASDEGCHCESDRPDEHPAGLLGAVNGCVVLTNSESAHGITLDVSGSRYLSIIESEAE